MGGAGSRRRKDWLVQDSHPWPLFPKVATFVSGMLVQFGVCEALKWLLNLSFFECISLELSIILGLAYPNKCL